MVVVLKAREPARIMTAIGYKATNRWHLQIADRWVIQYNVYINDREWGGCLSACAPTCRSEQASASISITGWHHRCGRKGLASGSAPTLSSIAPIRCACNSWLTLSRRNS